ncbi:hypothetical protein AAFC00_005629 [Neodothiora populina]|uniref:Bifunctional cytochrome P450/NADPH--P450 reductase n=1 Tax=Neodothiora populina TaxID=2781224 RepID=A0ABR3PLI8_9PEZI
MTTEIPHPPGLPLIGNVRDVDAELPIVSLSKLADTYGEVFSFSLAGNRRVVISSVELMDELCNEQRFSKMVSAGLAEVRNGTHDGLFTAQLGEHNWEIAHRVLVPAFGPLNIRAMFDDMKDIGSQLVMKWARHGPNYKIPVTDDFTRLTLDTLALCSMNYRFNSFYQEKMHPFVDAMVDFLIESGNRARRSGLLSIFYRNQEYQYWRDIEYMRKLSHEIVQTRRDNPEDKKDLLNAMINGKDPKTGESLTSDSIVDNMITFLIAGHETTSGMLSFVFYYLLKNPAAYAKAQQEVDQVVGNGSIQVEHLSKLPYITAVLRETLRLQPTAPAFTLHPLNEIDTIGGGKYTVYGNEPILALLPKIHRDPAVYGEDAEEWKPERMLDENFNKLPKNAWKPFGQGQRACIGRPFAWQEALIVTVMLLQYFDLGLNDPEYELQIKQTLTIKPKGLYMNAKIRHGLTATQLEQSLASSMPISQVQSKAQGVARNIKDTAVSAKDLKPMTILYGSNTGTCQALAQRASSDAPAHGFTATVDTLDSAKGNIPKDRPVLIITASYEGQPCDNAAQFYNWLETSPGDLTGVAYAVFGAGHSDWKATFHRIPTSIDEIIAKNGGERLCERGGADVASGDIFSDFEVFGEDKFWTAVSGKYGVESTAETAPSLSVEVSNVRSSHLRADVYEAKVLDARSLSSSDAPEKRHIEIQLPSNMTYRSGDYLAILPINPPEIVMRAMRHFDLAWDSTLTIGATASGTMLPTGVPVSAQDLFGAYVELNQPATRRNLLMLVEACSDDDSKAELERLSGDAYTAEVSEKRVSVLDLLDKYPSVHLPIGTFLACLPPMRTRQYSISSSPLWNPNRVTLTYSVLHQTHMSGTGEYVGVASNYLSKLATGDTLHVAVRQSGLAFHPPTDAENTPVMMVASGTGLAPFRGFVQERAAQIGAGRTIAPALFFVGCRDPDKDELYRQEFDKWESMGAVKVIRAYSRRSELSNECKYVQDQILAHKTEVLKLWDEGAKVFVCGSRNLEVSVREVSKKLHIERKACSEEEAGVWYEGLRNARFATDVFT